MSEPINISPLLDGYTLGAPIAEHHGVVCYPAIKENTNKKYIVKKLSVPASQTQFDALMLAGAYKDPADAMEYFRENGEAILNEAELLKKLSKIDGFLPYDGWQMEPITRRRLGYEIYLVGSYKRSLEKYIQKNAFTHLEAVNLALDLCSALAVCRQSGFLYVDLKPSNVYVSEKKEYRIGDLGFISLDALRYASLPERYFSPYTPPELLDPMASMNLSVDTYAVGMILYQLYNDGHLPFTGTVLLETLPTPCHADYEMAEIIMKAIHPDPQQRWMDPKDLGKAIASYMQKNRVNDVPITQFMSLDVKPEEIVAAETEKANKEDTDALEIEQEEQNDSILEDEEKTDAAGASEPTNVSDNGVFSENTDILQMDEAVITSEENMPDASEKISETVIDDQPKVETETSASGEVTAVLQDREEEFPLESVSEDVARILTKANDIIAHEIPEEAVFPAEEVQPDPFAFAMDDAEDMDAEFPVDPLMEEATETETPEKKKKTKHFLDPTRKNKFRKFLSGCFTILLLAGASVAGFWYYQNIYLQTVDALTVSGTQNEITVLIDTSIEESKLSVLCTDENGKRYSEPVQGGKATFTGLKPSTRYTIQVDMTGFHKVAGQASDSFTTDAETQILSFEAIAGSEHGSVILNFTAEGDDPDFWNIRYTAEGEEERLETVTGTPASITGLTVGKVYTFTLDGGTNFDLGGETSVQYLASRLILAEDLTVTSTNGSDVTVQWDTPGDVVVESWNVRCYDGYGFEEQVTVTENQVQFTGIDPSSKYTVEVTAAGMTEPSRILISADPIPVSGFKMDETAQTEMKITWEHTGNAPEDGWVLNYTVDGSGSQMIPCEKASAKISPLIPGANYEFVLLAGDDRTVFNNRVQYQTKEAKAFTENKFSIQNVTFHLLKTPEDSKWHFETVSEDAFTDTFDAGDSVSMVMQSSTDVYLPGNKTQGLFVFRDTYGNIIPELVTETSFNWKNIWNSGDSKTAELDLPNMPTTPGSYKMELYFNGCFVTDFDITIAE